MPRGFRWLSCPDHGHRADCPGVFYSNGPVGSRCPRCGGPPAPTRWPSPTPTAPTPAPTPAPSRRRPKKKRKRPVLKRFRCRLEIEVHAKTAKDAKNEIYEHFAESDEDVSDMEWLIIEIPKGVPGEEDDD